MKKYTSYIIVLIVLLVGGFLIFRPNKDSEFSKTNYYLGTVNTVTIYGKNQKDAEKILSGCDKVVQNIDNLMSTEIPGSDVSKINKNAGIKPTIVSEETYEVIKDAIYYSKLSGGNFDVTIGPISNLWSIGKKDARVPEKSEIDNLLSLVDYKNIEMKKEIIKSDTNNDGIKESTDTKYTVFLKNKNMKIDLGAIAKGYAADTVSSYLRLSDVDRAIINLGGNIKTIGNFTIGIKNPFENANDSFASIKVNNKSIVTSGVYERFVEKDGKKYHHILSPSNGYPFDNNLLSVTIVSNKSINCDALSTSAFALGLEEGKKLIESIDDVDAIFVTKDKKIYLTKGFDNNFKLLNNDFTLIK
ncbi:FAD:protein FMN transferase [Peptacetobacter sp.]|uniref:FAD:protein FMN transferase n=1 Tax=Peptacetobacter sp. TaxID=2991975 RepID=UPI002634FED8|nr:FAD:protein FMN transferase [Peptacetobacter sp.]